MAAIIIRQFDRVEKCNFLFYTHFSAVSVTELYFTCILFIVKFVPISVQIENFLCQNIFIALPYNSLHFHTISHSCKFMGKPSFRLNIEWCILSSCPVTQSHICHSSFSSSHHHLTPFPWDTWSPWEQVSSWKVGHLDIFYRYLGEELQY